jgi:hypothetical protein
MACHPVRTALLVGCLCAAAVNPARAQEPCAPKMRTITVTECCEEKFQTQRTCYRVECQKCVVDGFRTERVCVPVDRVCTVTKRIPVVTCQTRQVCCTQVCYEDRVVMKRCYEYQQVCKTVKKCVSRGHWECKTVCYRSLFDHLFHHKSCDPCCTPCCKTKTKKCWVNCPVYVDCQVMCCQKICVEKPVVCKVKVCKPIIKEVQVQVCTYQCVQEQCVRRCYQTVCRQVPCQTVCYKKVCVPYTETVWCTRLVPRTREVQVQECAPCTPCCPTTSCCPRSCGGLHHRSHGCCSY